MAASFVSFTELLSLMLVSFTTITCIIAVPREPYPIRQGQTKEGEEDVYVLSEEGGRGDHPLGPMNMPGTASRRTLEDVR